MKKLLVLLPTLFIGTTVAAAQIDAKQFITVINISDKCAAVTEIGTVGDTSFFQSQNSTAPNYLPASPRVYNFYIGTYPNVTVSAQAASGETKTIELSVDPYTRPILPSAVSSVVGPSQYVMVGFAHNVLASNTYYVFPQYFDSKQRAPTESQIYVPVNQFDIKTCQPAVATETISAKVLNRS